jgi:hypothetical protein
LAYESHATPSLTVDDRCSAPRRGGRENQFGRQPEKVGSVAWKMTAITGGLFLQTLYSIFS